MLPMKSIKRNKNYDELDVIEKHTNKYYLQIVSSEQLISA